MQEISINPEAMEANLATGRYKHTDATAAFEGQYVESMMRQDEQLEGIERGVNTLRGEWVHGCVGYLNERA
jgi:hypothetical protein